MSRPTRAWPIVLALVGCVDDDARPPTGEAAEDAETAASADGETAADTDDGESTSTSTSTGDLPDDGETIGDDAESSDDAESGDGAEIVGPLLYPGGRIHSPLAGYAVEVLASIHAQAGAVSTDRFAKVGASSTVSTATLHCFATGPVDLGAHVDALDSALTDYLAGEIEGTTSFDRHSSAAMSGAGAGWAISGEPSPFAQELAAFGDETPSVALIHYGANDMHLGLTYASALPGYHANMTDLLDQSIAAGVVPVVFGISRRLDSPSADRWVQTYNGVARGLAQARQIPFVDLREALEPLPGFGLSGDGLHLEAYSEGACILDDAGLEHGYNVRNLVALQLLARALSAVVEGVPPDPEPTPGPATILVGDGSHDQPFEIAALPFADARDSALAPGLELDVYSGCGSNADESGPENLYRIELDATTSLRAVVLDRAGVDVDIHLLDDSASEVGCIARDDLVIEETVGPGTYYFALDTYVNGEGVEQSGEYTFVVVECDPDDPDCLL